MIERDTLQRLCVFTLIMVIIVNIITLYVFAQDNTQNSAHLFLLDTSLSMKKNNQLQFKQVKEFINKKVDLSKKGDVIVVIIFDEITDVVINSQVSSVFSKEKIKKEVNRLYLKGQWTWIQKGLEQLNKTVHLTKLKYSDHLINVYFLTDGNDDPPPKSKEKKKSFLELVNQNFSGYNKTDSCIYVLYSDADSDHDGKVIEKKFAVSEKVGIETNLIQTLQQSESISEPETNSNVKLETSNKVKVNNKIKKFLIKNKWVIDTFNIRNILFYFIFPVLIFLLIVVIFIKIFPTVTVWVEGEYSNDIVPVKVNVWRKSFLERIGLPNHYLIKDRFDRIIYLGETIDNKINFLKNGQMISCVLLSGQKQNFIFHFFPTCDSSSVLQF